jgi:2-aminoethylphosphonate-pyruvate transaminase
MKSSPILFTPGPVRIPAVVADAMANPPCNYHRQAGFRAMFAEIQTSLAELLGLRRDEKGWATDYFAAIMTATGTGANEGCLQAFAALGTGLILRNGFFGARLVDQAVQNGLAHQVLDGAPELPLDAAAVAAHLDAHPEIKWCFFVSHETRMGLVNPLVEIGQACAARGVAVGADIISSAFAYPVDIEAARLDLAVTSSAKAVMAAPGLGIVFVRLAALPVLKAAKSQRSASGSDPLRGFAPTSYYLDVIAECERQRAEHQPRFAQPVALYAALHAACRHMREVGIDAHMARIQRQMDKVAAHVARYGCKPLLPREHLSWIAVNFELPPGLTYSEFAPRMQAEGYFLLYGVPGNESHFQVSTIGDLTDGDVDGLLRAFDNVFGPAASMSLRGGGVVASASVPSSDSKLRSDAQDLLRSPEPLFRGESP